MPVPTPTKALLVGSMPCKDNNDAFTTASRLLNGKLTYIPDGETAHRGLFIFFLFEKLPQRIRIAWDACENDDLTPTEPEPPLQLAEFESTTYDVEAIASYKVFCGLREEGVISPDVKFQVCLPTTTNIVRMGVQTRYCLAAEPFVETRIIEALTAIQDAIPAEDLCIQWDMPTEILQLEHARVTGQWRPILQPYNEKPLQAFTDGFNRLYKHVRAGVDVGVHLCYGDLGHVHFIEPLDAGLLVEFANALIASLPDGRKLAYLHLPVPKERDDESYFAPLKGFNHDGALYLGLVRENDVSGSRKRLETARQVLSKEFGISSECGLGRLDHDELLSVLKTIKQLTT